MLKRSFVRGLCAAMTVAVMTAGMALAARADDKPLDPECFNYTKWVGVAGVGASAIDAFAGTDADDFAKAWSQIAGGPAKPPLFDLVLAAHMPGEIRLAAFDLHGCLQITGNANGPTYKRIRDKAFGGGS